MEEDGRWTREQWSEQRGAEITGSSKSGTGRKSDFEETMRIAPDAEGVLTFWARPNKARDETPFRRNQGNVQGNWIFENSTNDYPQRIIYSRDGGWLFATIMQSDGSRNKNLVYRPAKRPRARPGTATPKARDVESAVTFSRRCVDEDGFTNCLPPTTTKIRNLICWPMRDLTGYIEPYRSSPAAECSFESRTKLAWTLADEKNTPTRWRADWARLHYVKTNDCSPQRCKRDWYIPRD